MKQWPYNRYVATEVQNQPENPLARCDLCGETFRPTSLALRYRCAACWADTEDWGDQLGEENGAVVDVIRSDEQYHGVQPWVT